MKKEYKGYRIDFKCGYFWFAGQAFNTLQAAKDEIDIFLEELQEEEEVYYAGLDYQEEEE